MKIISSFRGEYSFLSNMYTCDILYGNIQYHSAENAFQGSKCIDQDTKVYISLLTPSRSKQEGKKVILRDDWERVKDTVMAEIVLEKFIQNPDLLEKLINTGDRELVEGNTWKDFYWGRCNGVGQNKLGRILMQVRKQLS